MVDCQKCGYRIMLAKIADIHVWKEDCDKYGTDLCWQINAPIVIPKAQTINVKRPSDFVIHSYGERKNND